MSMSSWLPKLKILLDIEVWTTKITLHTRLRLGSKVQSLDQYCNCWNWAICRTSVLLQLLPPMLSQCNIYRERRLAWMMTAVREVVVAGRTARLGCWWPFWACSSPRNYRRPSSVFSQPLPRISSKCVIMLLVSNLWHFQHHFK